MTLAAKDKPDLVLLDVNNAGEWAGLEVVPRNPRGSERAIIMLTVRNAERDKVPH